MSDETPEETENLRDRPGVFVYSEADGKTNHTRIGEVSEAETLGYGVYLTQLSTYAELGATRILLSKVLEGFGVVINTLTDMMKDVAKGQEACGKGSSSEGSPTSE